jgi:hypothetical protein
MDLLFNIVASLGVSERGRGIFGFLIMACNLIFVLWYLVKQMSSTTVRDFVLKIPKNRNNDHDDVKQPVYFNLKITQPTHRVVIKQGQEQRWSRVHGRLFRKEGEEELRRHELRI